MQADVVVLQEVTGPWLRALLRQEWVRRNYYSSDGPECLTLNNEYGQIILAKFPFRCSVRQRDGGTQFLDSDSF